MKQFWEEKFSEMNLMWGLEPSDCAIYALDLFRSLGIRNILVPGIGYGRNAQLFYKNGIRVTGIEISRHAIGLANKTLGLPIRIHHGSVTGMPYDDVIYDGIFCYALLHLLNKNERARFIRNCYEQTRSGGYMIFSVVSRSSTLYGQGKKIGMHRFNVAEGVNVYFYDLEAAVKEFGKFGLVEAFEMDEPIKFKENEPPFRMIVIKCRKF